jgi:hypothetical protein
MRAIPAKNKGLSVPWATVAIVTNDKLPVNPYIIAIPYNMKADENEPSRKYFKADSEDIDFPKEAPHKA